MSLQSSKVSTSSKRSHTGSDIIGERPGRPAPRINLFKLVVATRAWQKLAKTSSHRLSDKSKGTVKYENTYKTEPDVGKHFAVGKVEAMLKETLEKRLNNVKYTPENCRLITTELTADIKIKVKAMEFPRYKLVCNVYITENKQQGLQISSRCMWNHSTDNFASYTYRNPSLIAVANVYGVYFE